MEEETSRQKFEIGIWGVFFSLECLPGAPLPSALLRKEEAIMKEVFFSFELLAGFGAGRLVPLSPPCGLSEVAYL